MWYEAMEDINEPHFLYQISSLGLSLGCNFGKVYEAIPICVILVFIP